MQYEFMGREVRTDILANLLNARHGAKSFTYIHYFTGSSKQAYEEEDIVAILLMPLESFLFIFQGILLD